MMVYYAQRSEDHINLAFWPAVIKNDTTHMLFILAWVGLGIATLNILINIFKSRNGYFVLGAVMMVLVVMSVFVNGVLWRNLRLHQTSAGLSESCNDTQRTISENDLVGGGWDKWCIRKYLETGTCRKVDLAFYWEKWQKDQTSTTKTLDPSCCKQAVSYLLWPLFCLGFCSFFFTVFLMFGLGCNWFLAYAEVQTSVHEKKFVWSDWAVLLLALIAIGLALLLFFWIKLGKTTQNPFSGSYYDLEAHEKEDPNYKIVPGSIIKDANDHRPLCYLWDKTRMPLAKTSSL